MGYNPQGHKESDTTERLHFLSLSFTFMGFPVGLEGKASACNAGDLGAILGWEDPLKKEMAIHSSTLAWKNPMDGGAW